MCRETVLEVLEIGYRRSVENVRRKRKEMKRRSLVEGTWRGAIEQRLRAKGEAIWVKDARDDDGDKWGWKVLKALRAIIGMKRKKHNDYHQHHRRHNHGRHLNLDALTLAELEGAALEAGVPLDELLPADYMISRQRRKQRAKRCSEDGNSKSGDHESIRFDGKLRRGFHSTNVTKLTHARMGGMVAMLGRFALAVHDQGGHDWNGLTVQESDVPNHRPKIELEPTMTMTSTGNESVSGILIHPSNIQESFREGLEKEERRAFVARLVIAWSLFVLFWVVSNCRTRIISFFRLTSHMYIHRWDLLYSKRPKDGRTELLCISVGLTRLLLIWL
jgi:potassium channel subfamily K, other eukaryote